MARPRRLDGCTRALVQSTARTSKLSQVYDCFPFFKELDILEIRLRELWDLADKFVLVESHKTHMAT